MIPRVRAAFLSLRILFELARGSTPMFWPGTAIPLICRCLSSNSAATLDLYNIRSCLSASLYILQYMIIMTIPGIQKLTEELTSAQDVLTWKIHFYVRTKQDRQERRDFVWLIVRYVFDTLSWGGLALVKTAASTATGGNSHLDDVLGNQDFLALCTNPGRWA